MKPAGGERLTVSKGSRTARGWPRSMRDRSKTRDDRGRECNRSCCPAL